MRRIGVVGHIAEIARLESQQSRRAIDPARDLTIGGQHRNAVSIDELQREDRHSAGCHAGGEFGRDAQRGRLSGGMQRGAARLRAARVHRDDRQPAGGKGNFPDDLAGSIVLPFFLPHRLSVQLEAGLRGIGVAHDPDRRTGFIVPDQSAARN